jgi:DNA-binding MarR family transcriptional regulator
VVNDDFSGRTWDVNVGTVGDVKEEKERLKQKKAEEKRSKAEWERQQRVIKAMRLHPEGISQTQLRNEAGMNAQSLADTILDMRKKGLIEPTPGMSGKQRCDLLKLTDKAAKNTDEKATENTSDEPRDYGDDFKAYNPYRSEF